MDTVPALFRQYAAETLARYEKQIGVCLDRLTDEQIWQRDNEHVNSIGNLILHLNGNLGQLILSSIGGAPDTRERDAEFNASGGISKAELRSRMAARVHESIELIRGVADARLTEQVLAKDEPLPVLTLIFRVVQHFALHSGQIMMRTKQLTATELGFTTHKRAAG